MRFMRSRLLIGSSVVCALAACAPSAQHRSSYPGAYALFEAKLGDSHLDRQENYSGTTLHIDPEADFSPYYSLIVDVVVLWASPEPTEEISRKDGRTAARFLYAAFRRELGAYFKIVEKEGPSVLRLRGAIALSTTPPRPSQFVAAASSAGGGSVSLDLEDPNALNAAYLEVTISGSETDELLLTSVVHVADLALDRVSEQESAAAAIDRWVGGLREGLVDLVKTTGQGSKRTDPDKIGGSL